MSDRIRLGVKADRVGRGTHTGHRDPAKRLKCQLDLESEKWN